MKNISKLDFRNVFIQNNAIKLGDFGLIYSHRSINKCNKDEISYMSPEYLKRCIENLSTSISYNTDLFSAACVFYEISTLKKAFNQNTIDELIVSILNCNKACFKLTSNRLLALNPILEQYVDFFFLKN